MNIKMIRTRNSLYEIDVDGKRARRVSGVNRPTDNFKEDGLWHDLKGCYQVGRVIVFEFAHGGCTTTSQVIE